MSTERLQSITVCLGSSCFSRGNNRNLEVLQSHLAAHPVSPPVELTGHLCEGHCKSGPNVTINGHLHHEVNPVILTDLLQHYRGKGPA